MREIKFRVWETDIKKMNYGERNDLCLPIQNGIVSGWNDEQGWDDFYTKNYIPMQYTGLKDKKGEEIYEGDIVNNGYCQGKAIIVFEDGMYFTKEIGMVEEQFKIRCVNTFEECMTFLCSERTKDMKVVGNIYENPELLEGKK